jgi:hypothetical protein
MVSNSQVPPRPVARDRRAYPPWAWMIVPREPSVDGNHWYCEEYGQRVSRLSFLKEFPRGKKKGNVTDKAS